jgi:hypothetical protein
MSNISYLNSLPVLSYILPPTIPGIFSTGTILAFTYMSTVFAPHSPSYPLSQPPSLSYCYQPPLLLSRTCSALLFFNFVEEKRKGKNENFACLR